MPLPDGHPLHALSWFKLHVTLRCVRVSPRMREHPISVMQAIVKGVNHRLLGADDPCVLFHAVGRRSAVKKFRLHEVVSLEVLFTSHGEGQVHNWARALTSHLADPVTGRNFEILDMGSPERRTLASVIGECDVADAREICLDFLTPLPFTPSPGRDNTHITQEAFIAAFTDRFSVLMQTKIDFPGRPDAFAVVPLYWEFTPIDHSSASQKGETQKIKGCTGRLFLKGDLRDILPFVIMGSELHAGRKIANSQGYYLLNPDPPGFFSARWPERKAIVSVVRDVIERYDAALGSLTEGSGLPFDEVAFSGALHDRLMQGDYSPSPNVAFRVAKKDGSDRIVERPHATDLIVEQYLKRTLAPHLERAFEPSSIGFRPGLSREKAAEVVRAALDEGFAFVLETDIEDFFPSVDLGRLEGILDRCLPSADIAIKAVLLAALRKGYVLEGRLHERTRGLAQGSPLSPLLANLYLDSFDEAVGTLGLRMVRYADDFVVLTRTRQEAEEALSRIRELLGALGLGLKERKTAVRRIAEGFTFLGMTLGGPPGADEEDAEFEGLAKPLYVCEPNLFLGLSGGALEIRNGARLIESVPFRRISEIMVMDKASFSTAVLSKCTTDRIPLTITLNSGYYVTTIKPDSKRHHDIAYAQGARYRALTEAERFVIAKEFAACKVRNYAALFGKRYRKRHHPTVEELRRIADRLYAAGSLEEVRGFEGVAARKAFATMNEFITNEAFHIKKRERRNPDPINSLLNFAHYLTFSRINATLRALGLNPYLGFLHSPEDRYESLAADVQELFRAGVEGFLIRLVNIKAVSQADFTETEKGFYLRHDAVKAFIGRYEAELGRKPNSRTLSMQEGIYVQCKVIRNYFLDNKPLTLYTLEG